LRPTEKKIAAPPKRDPEPGERFQIGVRVTPDLKRRLDAAAEESGRSQTQEAELRLERSFDRQDLLIDALVMAYGSKPLAGLLMMVAMTMLEAGDQMAYRLLGGRRPVPGPGVLSDDAWWLADPKVADVAIEAAITVLESVRPKGDTWTDAGFGACVANGLIRSLRKEEGNPGWSLLNSVAALGPIAARMREIAPAELRERLRGLTERLAHPVETIVYDEPEEEKDAVTHQAALASMFGRRRA
jgi:hypothetical protein